MFRISYWGFQDVFNVYFMVPAIVRGSSPSYSGVLIMIMTFSNVQDKLLCVLIRLMTLFNVEVKLLEFSGFSHGSRDN